MLHPLAVTFSTPLEREYEAWIIRGIEKYFETLGHQLQVWAVTPKEEAIWPADEKLIIGTKLIGLQIKRPQYVPLNTKAMPDFNRLKWSFYNPPNQMSAVMGHSEIYFCLPTFLNRKIKNQALSHCIFWRPPPSSSYVNVAWYNNDQASTPYNSLRSSIRWGLFLENILNCSIGRRIDTIDQAEQFFSELQVAFEEFPLENHEIVDEEEGQPVDRFPSPTTYVLAIPLIETEA